MAGLGLSGCSSATELLQTRTVVRQWNLLAGSDGAVMTSMHEQFARDFPDVELRATTFGWGVPFYTKLAMGASGGNAADVATIHVSRLGSLSPETLLDPITTAELEAAGLSPTDFPSGIWEKCFWEDKLYAVPIDTHTLVNYYNTIICEQAGVLDSEGVLIETDGVEEYFDVLRAVKDVTGEFGTSLDTFAGWRQFWAWYRQQEGELTFTDDDFQMDDDKALTAIEIMYRMADEGLCPTFSDGSQTSANFENGAAGMVQVGNWEIGRFRPFAENHPDTFQFRMAEIPSFFNGHRYTQGDSHAYVLPHHNSWDPEVRTATMQYIAYMLQHSLEWAEGGGHTPAYLPVSESEEYQSMMPQAEYAGVAENVQFDPEAWFSGSAARLFDAVSQVLQQVYALQLQPEPALDLIKARLRELLALPNPVD